MDRNVDYKSGTYKLLDSTASYTNLIGCYHLQLSTEYATYSEAKTVADGVKSARAFVKYLSGRFYVCVGAYRNSAAARAAASALGYKSGYTVNCGTAYTVTVVETGGTDILFEFDYDTTYTFGVKAIYDGDSLIKYKNFRYYGSFMFSRKTSGVLTVINVVDIENYVRCSVPYESYPSWPVEALKAQAVCARNYVISHLGDHASKGFDVCNTTCCQVYYGDERCSTNSNQAVDETKGQYLTYNNGKLCDTYYADSDGGATESAENVWGSSMTTYPYLKGKVDIYEPAIASQIKNYYYTYTYTGAELTQLMKSKGYNCSTIVSCEITKFSPSGNPIEIVLTDSNGRAFIFPRNKGKQLLGARSQHFTITDNRNSFTGEPIVDGDGRLGGALDSSYAIGEGGIIDRITGGKVYAATGEGVYEIIGSDYADPDPEDVVYTISGSGNGHNVGMSQWGAYAMCSEFGKNYIEILQFYFDGSVISTNR